VFGRRCASTRCARLKTGSDESRSWVRISPPPPVSSIANDRGVKLADGNRVSRGRLSMTASNDRCGDHSVTVRVNLHCSGEASLKRLREGFALVHILRIRRYSQFGVPAARWAGHQQKESLHGKRNDSNTRAR
jgi:hypothetical protein